MAAFEAVERLQKFDWLIQKLHSLRNTFNSDQGIQELQKLHALQLLHRNGIQFNESIGDNEEERILEEKITGDEEEQEEDEDLDDIEEDTEVIDDETDDNDDNANNQKPESITSNGSQGSQALYNLQHPKTEAGEPSLEPGHQKLEEAEGQNSEGGIVRDTAAPAPRFPTGLFPPLPFDPAILSGGDGTGIKVGILFNFGQKFVGFYEQIRSKTDHLVSGRASAISPHPTLFEPLNERLGPEGHILWYIFITRPHLALTLQSQDQW